MTQSLLTLMEVLYVDHVVAATPLFEQTLAGYLGFPGSRLLRGPAANLAQTKSSAFVALKDGMTIEVRDIVGSPIEHHLKHGAACYFRYAVGNMEASIAKAQSAGAELLTPAVADAALDGRSMALLFHETLGIFELAEAAPSLGAGWVPPPSIATPQTDVSAGDANVRLRKLFGKVFPVLEEGKVETATINFTPGWDSLTHIRLVMEIEAEFGIDILPDDIGRLTSYRSIRDQLERDVR